MQLFLLTELGLDPRAPESGASALLRTLPAFPSSQRNVRGVALFLKMLRPFLAPSLWLSAALEGVSFPLGTAGGCGYTQQMGSRRYFPDWGKAVRLHASRRIPSKLIQFPEPQSLQLCNGVHPLVYHLELLRGSA